MGSHGGLTTIWDIRTIGDNHAAMKQPRTVCPVRRTHSQIVCWSDASLHHGAPHPSLAQCRPSEGLLSLTRALQPIMADELAMHIPQSPRCGNPATITLSPTKSKSRRVQDSNGRTIYSRGNLRHAAPYVPVADCEWYGWYGTQKMPSLLGRLRLCGPRLSISFV